MPRTPAYANRMRDNSVKRATHIAAMPPITSLAFCDPGLVDALIALRSLGSVALDFAGFAETSAAVEGKLARRCEWSIWGREGGMHCRDMAKVPALPICISRGIQLFLCGTQARTGRLDVVGGMGSTYDCDPRTTAFSTKFCKSCAAQADSWANFAYPADSGCQKVSLIR